MNHKSKLLSVAAYGSPSIARAMNEVDTHRFDGASKAAAAIKMNVNRCFGLGSVSKNTPEGRAKKVEWFRNRIAEGKIQQESMPAILRDYPELKQKGTK